MRKPTKTSLTRKCDQIFSQLIRSLGYCERCNSTENLQTCHIKTRKYRTLRWEKLNSNCLCATCHRFFHDNPDTFGEWLDKKWPGRRQELDRLLQKPIKVTVVWLSSVLDTLKQQLADQVKQ